MPAVQPYITPMLLHCSLRVRCLGFTHHIHDRCACQRDLQHAVKSCTVGLLKSAAAFLGRQSCSCCTHAEGAACCMHDRRGTAGKPARQLCCASSRHWTLPVWQELPSQSAAGRIMQWVKCTQCCTVRFCFDCVPPACTATTVSALHTSISAHASTKAQHTAHHDHIIFCEILDLLFMRILVQEVDVPVHIQMKALVWATRAPHRPRASGSGASLRKRSWTMGPPAMCVA